MTLCTFELPNGYSSYVAVTKPNVHRVVHDTKISFFEKLTKYKIPAFWGSFSPRPLYLEDKLFYIGRALPDVCKIICPRSIMNAEEEKARPRSFPVATDGSRGGNWEGPRTGRPKKLGSYTCKTPALNIWPEDEESYNTYVLGFYKYYYLLLKILLIEYYISNTYVCKLKSLWEKQYLLRC